MKINLLEERIPRVLFSYPLLEMLVNRNQYGASFQKYNGFSIGVTALLYLLEQLENGDEGVEYVDMADFLRLKLTEYDRQIEVFSTQKEQEDFIIKVLDILENKDGRSFTVDYLDYGTVPILTKTRSFRLIERKEVEQNGRLTIVMSLSQEGLQFLYLTKEIDQHLEISFTQMLLEQQIRNGHYSKAEQSVKNLVAICERLRQGTRQFLSQLQHAVLPESPEEVKRRHEENQKHLQDEIEIFDRLLSQVNEIKDQISEDLEEKKRGLLARHELGKAEELENQFSTQLATLYRIENRLHECRKRHMALLHDNGRLFPAYLDMFQRAFKTTSTVQVHYYRDIFQPWLNLPGQNDAQKESLLRLLLGIRPHRFLSVDQLIPAQPKPEQVEAEGIPIEEIEVAENRALELYERSVKISTYFFNLLLDKLCESPERKLCISEIQPYLAELPTEMIQEFLLLMVTLFQERDGDFANIRDERLRHIVKRVLAGNSKGRILKGLRVTSSQKPPVTFPHTPLQISNLECQLITWNAARAEDV